MMGCEAPGTDIRASYEKTALQSDVAHNGEVNPDDDLRAARGVIVPADAMEWSFARSSGAGGQNVNKTSTKASLTVALHDDDHREAALITFLVTLSGVVLAGVGSAFWGVVAGALALLVQHYRRAPTPTL